MLSKELTKIYTNYNDNRRYFDTVQLFHSKFNVVYPNSYPSKLRYPSNRSYPSKINYPEQSYFLVRDSENHAFQIDDGSSHVFQAYPFNIIQPEVGSDQQDIGIVLDNVSLEVIKNIELAAKTPSDPIQMVFRVYIEGSTVSQTTPLTLSLTEISVDMFTVTCKASRVDLYKRKFPFGNSAYFNNRFKGLYL